MHFQNVVVVIYYDYGKHSNSDKSYLSFVNIDSQETLIRQ